MFIIHIIFYINILYFSQNKNIILPFKKMTIEDFNGNNTINDLITYNIYTNISMGTPPQTVAHFFDQNDFSFYFQKKLLSHQYIKTKTLENYDKKTNFWFNNKNSSTFIMKDKNGFSTETFYFNTLNNSKVKIDNLRYNIYLSDAKDKIKCGVIGLNHISNTNIRISDIHINFIEELKKREVISDYTFTILYNEHNNLFNYNKNLNLGAIIFGESPYIYNSDKYKKEDEIVNTEKDWSILINEVKFTSGETSYIEENIEMQISIISGFIRGSFLYRKEIEKIFFSELIKNNLCKIEHIEENVYNNLYFIYSCENNKDMEEKIKNFPSLIFEVKTNNLTFIFNYKDLFKIYNNRLYFMVIFREEKYISYLARWTMGEIFLRKYLTTINFDSKTIIFYRNQVNEMNIKSQIIDNPKESTKKNFTMSKNIRTIIEIIMGLFIIVILYLLYRKYRNSRKIHANELEDSNYVYVPNEKNNSKTLKKERELNKIIN